MRSLYFLRGGVIFISIDDNEQAQLKLLCDEIFGRKQFVDVFSWVKTETPANLSKHSKKAVEYILCYTKGYNENKFRGLSKTSVSNNGLMNQTNSVHELLFPANKIDTKLSDGIYPKGKYGTSSYDIELLDNTEVKNGYFVKPVHLRGRFKWGQANLEKEISKGTTISIKTKAFSPSYEKKEYEPEVPWNLINKSFGVDTNETASTRLKDIFGENAFDFPKPVSLIKYLINFIPSSTILDFFAGSGTTLHATMQLNKEDGGHRKCILVTNNENGICENVTYERNKRVIQGYTTPKGKAVEGLHNNTLRYYRTNFLSRDKSVKNMRQLVRLATDMLCIKNDVYTEAEFCGKKINPNIARYFDNGQGNRMLVIYEERAIQLLVQLMAQTEDDGIKTMVYVFSPGADPYTDDFEDIAERVKLCALPSAIYEAYKRVLPKRKPKFLDEALQEMKAQAEAEANAQQTLDFGENDYMNEEGGEA